MSEARYYFPTAAGDDSLAVLAVIAKDVLRNNNNIVNIFQKNDELLYGESPRQALFLMKQNNRSIFSSSPISESSSSITRTNQEPSTPVTRNSDASDLPRKCLPFDNIEKKLFNEGTLETGTPVKQKSVIESCKEKDAATDETAEVGEHFASPIGSTDSYGPSNQESPSSVKMAMMTGHLCLDEKVLGSPTKMFSSPDRENRESPRSAEIITMTANLTVVEQDTNPTIVSGADGDINVSAQEFPRLVEPMKISSNLTVDDKESKGLVEDQSFTGLATDRHTVDIGKNAESSITPDSLNKDSAESSITPDSINKDSAESSEGTVKIPEQDEAGTPSPAKKFKMGNISAIDIQEFSSPAEMARLMDSSTDSSEVAVSPLKDDKTIINPKEATAAISGDRKNPSPKKITSTLFKSIPRVIQAHNKSEIDILVSGDVEGTTNPTTSQNPPTDCKSDKTEMKNLVDDNIKVAGKGKSVTDTLPKPIISLSCQENPITVSPSGNVSGIKKPDSNAQVLFLEQCSLDTPSTSATTTEESPSKSESSLVGPTALDYMNNLRFLNAYIDNLGYVVQQIGLKGNNCASKELKEIVNDALATTAKLKKKIIPWSIDVDLEVNTWNKCFQQIQQIKAKYGPLLSTEGKSQVSIEDLQVYEREMKVVWKKMDDMIMVEDSRRSLFSHTAHDFEMLIKLFVKSLIFVGILLPR